MSTAPALQLIPARAELWISRARFLELSGWTLQWLSNQVRNGNVRSRETVRKLANGRLEVEFAASSLPAKARAAMEQAAQPEPSAAVQPAQQALALFAPQPLPSTTRRMVVTKTEERTVAQRLNLLQPVLDFARDPNRYRALRLPDGSAVETQSDLVRYVAAHSQISERTLWRWLKRHEQGGEGALLKQPRKDRGQSQFFRDYPEAAAVVALVGFGDEQRRGSSVAATLRALSEQASALAIPKADLPDYSTVRRFLMGAPADLKVLARKGERRYIDLIMPHIEREYEDTPANAVWIADCMKADVEVQNDVFEHLELGAPIRLQLSAIVDYRSRYFVGTCWGTVESSIPIQAAIRNAVMAHGPAEHFYCDNGKAYRSVAAGAVPAYAAATPDDALTLYEQVRGTEQRLGLLARLGMKVTHCLPRHPQSKHIERQFRTVHEQYDALWQTYTAGAPHLRPFQTERMMALHRKGLKHNRPEWSMHPLASDYIAGFYAWLDWHHAQPMKNTRGMDGRSPTEVFQAERNPRQMPTPSLADLSVTFASRAERVVTRMAVEMWNDRYVPAEGDAVAAAQMLALSGDCDDRRRVTVLFDPLDHSAVAVTDERGHILCALVRQQLLKFAPHDKQTQRQVAAGRKAALGALRATKGKLAHIRQLGRAAGGRTPLELLADNAAADATMPDSSVVAQNKPTRRLPAKGTAPMYPHDVAKMIAAMED